MRHKVCDKEKQKKALEARAKKLADSGKQDHGHFLAMTYKARRKSRFKQDLDYPPGACKWCMAWGNDPDRAKHPDTACIHRPDGELQKKLKCTYQKMVNSTQPQALFKARKEVFKELREAKKAGKGKVKFSGASERVPDGERLRDMTVCERVPDTEAEASVPDEGPQEVGAGGEMEMEMDEPGEIPPDTGNPKG